MKKILFSLFCILLLLKLMVLSSGCANIIPPTGGPRDSLPPVLMTVTPPDSILHFKGKKITFTFDEYVQVDNPQQNILVSPTPKIMPFVETKLRTVTVTLKDTLEENTTYTLDFGNALKDINEGNPLKNFTYLFSTGDALDSLTLPGKVLIAETGQTDSTLVVMLHTSLEDSAVAKERPRYVARVNPQGKFVFRSLPPGTYALYALKDEGGTRRYLSRTQLFAFAEKPIEVRSGMDSVILYAYTEPEEPGENLPALPPKKPTAEEQEDKRLRIESSLSNNQQSLLTDLQLTFTEAPLRSFDSTKIHLMSADFQPVPGYTVTMDTSRTKAIITYKWPENTAYHLILDKDFAEDTLGKKLARTDTLDFNTKKTSDYGSVRLRFTNLDLQRNPVLLFIQNDKVVNSYAFTSKDFYSKLFEPGEYTIRILYDENRNGKWDPGHFFKEHRQPEKVEPVSRKLNIKANWDNEVDITL